MTALSPAATIALAALTAGAAAYDVRLRRIPNWVVLCGLVAGMGLNIALFQLAGLRFAGAGTGLALLVYVPLYALKAMGAGDVKLMAAVGAIVGPANWLAIFAFTAILGGLIALALVVARGRLRVTLRNVGHILGRLCRLRPPSESRPDLDVGHEKAVTLPHGVSIALGSALFLASFGVSL